MHVLIVDDDLDVQQFLKNSMKTLGCVKAFSWPLLVKRPWVMLLCRSLI